MPNRMPKLSGWKRSKPIDNRQQKTRKLSENAGFCGVSGSKRYLPNMYLVGTRGFEPPTPDTP